MKKYPWLKLGKKTDPELPLRAAGVARKPLERRVLPLRRRRAKRKMREEILRRADEMARRKGMDRRDVPRELDGHGRHPVGHQRDGVQQRLDATVRRSPCNPGRRRPPDPAVLPAVRRAARRPRASRATS